MRIKTIIALAAGASTLCPAQPAAFAQEAAPGTTTASSSQAHQPQSHAPQIIRPKFPAFTRPPMPHPHVPLIPDEGIVLSLTSLSEKQKGQIQSVYEALRTAKRQALEQGHARLMAARKYRGQAQSMQASISQPGSKMTAAQIQDIKQKAQASKNIGDNYARQIHSVMEQSEQTERTSYSRIRNVLTKAQLAELDQKLKANANRLPHPWNRAAMPAVRQRPPQQQPAQQQPLPAVKLQK